MAPSKADWLAAVGAELAWTTPDGIPVQPLYSAEDALHWPPAFPEGWMIRQDLDLPDVESFNREAREAVAQGVEVLGVRLDRAIRAGSGRCGYDGLDCAGRSDLQRALDGIEAPIALVAGVAGPAAACALDVPPAYLELDLAEALMWGHDLDWLAASTGELGGPVILSWQSLFEAGATPVRELAWAAGFTIDWLRRWPAAGPPLAWSFAVSGQLVLELAKLRAARVLAANLGEAFGVAAPRLHVRTGRRDLTCQDPPNNLLRLGLGALAGALGGAETLHVDPYTQPQGADSDSLRLARNQQHLLRHEGNLAEVGDPVAGAYAVERLAHEMAAAAWPLVQSLERSGGATQNKAERLLRELEQDRRQHQATLVGVTRYAGADGPRLHRPERPEVRPGGDFQSGDTSQMRQWLRDGVGLLELCPGGMGSEIPWVRFAEPFEGAQV